MKPGLEIKEIIERELLSWPDVTVGQHRFGGREFRIGKLELGHLHGSAVADLPFPRAMRDELVSSGRVSPHHHLPDSGWVSFYFRGEEDIPAALALFRRNYERIQRIVQRQRANTFLKESSQTEHESDH
jgi:Luciferase